MGRDGRVQRGGVCGRLDNHRRQGQVSRHPGQGRLPYSALRSGVVDTDERLYMCVRACKHSLTCTSISTRVCVQGVDGGDPETGTLQGSHTQILSSDFLGLLQKPPIPGPETWCRRTVQGTGCGGCGGRPEVVRPRVRVRPWAERGPLEHENTNNASGILPGARSGELVCRQQRVSDAPEV